MRLPSKTAMAPPSMALKSHAILRVYFMSEALVLMWSVLRSTVTTYRVTQVIQGIQSIYSARQWKTDSKLTLSRTVFGTQYDIFYIRLD